MHEKLAELLLHVMHFDHAAIGRGDTPGIAHLAAALAVERSLVGDERDLVAGLRRIDFLAALHQSGDDALRALGLIAEELAGADLLLQIEPDGLGRRLAGAGPGLSGSIP